MDITQIVKNPSTEVYKREMVDALKLSFPGLTEMDIREAIDYSILKRGNDSKAVLDNNYTKKKENTTLFAITDYIIQREPIITVSGVMFRKHGYCPNPFVMLIQEFLKQRGIYKDTMFKYPKGSEEFENTIFFSFQRKYLVMQCMVLLVIIQVFSIICMLLKVLQCREEVVLLLLLCFLKLQWRIM